MSVNIFQITLALICLTITPLFGVCMATDANVVAQVGTVPVTAFELAREQQRLVPFNVSFHSGMSAEKLNKLQNDALNTLIERAYKINYALAEKIEVDKEAIENQFNSYKKKFKTKDDLKQALGNESEREYRESIKRDLLSRKAEELAVNNKIEVTDDDIKTYYDTNKQMFKRPKQFKASHILIKVNPSSNKEERAALEAKTNDLAKRAKAGEDFYNLAYYNSDDRSKYVGGDLGYFHEGQTVKEFEDAVKKMKPGEISDPVKSMFGWHIIKLVEVNEARQLELDELKDKLKAQLVKNKHDKLYNDWLTELKAKYPVKKF